MIKFVRLLPIMIAAVLASCAAPDTQHRVVVSVRDQKLALLDKGALAAIYPVSTSKFGLGDSPGRCQTPLGTLEVAEKIGTGAALGTVFKDRHRTGENVAADAAGRDPIVTRIIWLRGLQAQNANAFRRYIYIHGTPEERKIGRPASYGCIRMRSRDVVQLYDVIGTGAQVTITDGSLASLVPGLNSASAMRPGNHGGFVIR